MSKKRSWYQIVRKPEAYRADSSVVRNSLYTDSDLGNTREELTKLRRRFKKYSAKDGTVIDDYGFLHTVPEMKIIRVTTEDVEE